MATFAYEPSEHEAERASNSYLMNLIAVIAGFPLPIINLIATVIFYFGNRNSTYFVRWHCTQALLSQFTLAAINGTGFSWTMSIIFGPVHFTSAYFAYLLTMVLVNFYEFVLTIYTAINIRKGIHTEWFFYGALTDLICRK